MPDHIDFTAANGVPFRAVYLPDGMSESRPAANKHNSEGKALVEFYDRRYEHTPDGQFISSYYPNTLLVKRFAGELDLSGLDLDARLPAWTIDGMWMNVVRCWLDDLIRPKRPKLGHYYRIGDALHGDDRWEYLGVIQSLHVFEHASSGAYAAFRGSPEFEEVEA